MNQLVFATNNKHKLEEVSEKIKGNFELLSLTDIGCFDEIEENGLTFHENASIKSKYIFNKYHLNCFGDDSGLEIDALNGEPGIYSARYAGKYGDHEANLNKVLDQLKDNSNRQARFKTVISLIWEGEEYFFEGTIEGIIEKTRTGDQGFGYDPIFKPNGHDKTFAQMSLDEKNQISHRALAVERLVDFLKKQ